MTEKMRVPEELTMNDLLDLCPADDIAGFHKDKVYFVCDSIYRGMGRLDRNMVHPEKKQPYFVPLSTKILRQVLGGNSYKGVLAWMEAAGIIQADGKWEAGEVSQGYRFTDYFVDNTPTWKTIGLWTILKKEWTDFFDNKLHFQPAVVKRLGRWFNPKKLKIDAAQALRIIEVQRDAATQEAFGNPDWIRQAAITAMADQTKVESFVRGEFPIVQDEFGYRVHTVLTQLPKEFRSLVTYEGLPLVEVDISCSQLFFSTFLLNHRHWRTAKSELYTKELWKSSSISSDNSSEFFNTIMYIKSCETYYQQGFKEHLFLQMCCDGQLYESVVDRLNAENYFPAGWDYPRKRKQVKTLLLDQLFANPADPDHAGLYCAKNKPILGCFQTLYPEVWQVYQRIKEGQEKGRYKDLCRLFQRIESIAMQGFVCKRLQADYPKIPIFTLHDCLITTAGNEGTVMEVMQQEIAKFMGYAPQMKQTHWLDYADRIPAPAKVRVVQ